MYTKIFPQIISSFGEENTPPSWLCSQRICSCTFFEMYLTAQRFSTTNMMPDGLETDLDNAALWSWDPWPEHGNYIHTNEKICNPHIACVFLFFKVWIHNLIHGWNPTKQSQMRPSPKLWLKMFTKHTLTGDRSAGNFIWAFLQLILGSHFFGTFNIYVLFSSTELAQLQNMVQERCRFAQLFSTYLTVGSNLRPVVQIWGLAIH